MLGNFHDFCRLMMFFKINFFKTFFQEYHQRAKQVVSRSGLTFVGHNLGSNCLQLLLADDNRRQRVNTAICLHSIEEFKQN